jgi:hypothetical protein
MNTVTSYTPNMEGKMFDNNLIGTMVCMVIDPNGCEGRHARIGARANPRHASG